MNLRAATTMIIPVALVAFFLAMVTLVVAEKEKATSSTATATAPSLVLSEGIMKVTKEAARLSMLAYEEEAPDDTITHDYSGMFYVVLCVGAVDFDMGLLSYSNSLPHTLSLPTNTSAFGYYDDEPDQALVVQLKAESGSYCFVAFRGTSLTFDDWAQNIRIGNFEVCVDIEGDGVDTCCTSRIGFYDAYDTTYRAEVEESVRECAKSCTDPDECVVITGHSQGGAVAAVAALILADLNPYVVTFGQPPTINAPCDLLTTDRIYRYVNTKTETGTKGIAYDPIPMAPGLGADHFGNMIVLSDDTTGVAFIGLDTEDYTLHPFINGVEAHFMRGSDDVNGTYTPGYADRIDALMANATYPIRNNGYVAGSLCSQDIECESKECGKELKFSWKRCVGIQCDVDDDCDTNRCDSGLCLSKQTSCMSCDEDSDCDGDDSMCLFYLCSNPFGKMDNQCVCRTGHDCFSGRCEGYTYPICEARLGNGGTCNENSDCKSNFCSWSYLCEAAEREKKVLGILIWVLIGLAICGVLYGIYFCFCKKKSGYTEVPSSE